MPLDAPVATRVAALNTRYRHHGATAVLERALTDPEVGSIGLVSSFGAESVVLLHLISIMDRKTPVLFIDTEMLFAETLAYQLDLTERLHLQDVRIIKPSRAAVFERDNEGILHVHDTDACCTLRKVEPLERTLADFDAWITGRKRFHGGDRLSLPVVEAAGEQLKFNPLANWAKADLDAYLALAPHAAAGLSFRAQVTLLLGDAAGALSDADAALKITPDDVAVLLVRGRARLALGRHDAAFADFSHVLEGDPRHAAALLGRGDVHVLRDNLADAQTDFVLAVSLTPQDPDAHYKLGLARFRLLEFASAVQSLETAARFAPESPLVARALGCAQFAAGEFGKAAQALQRAVDLDPAGATYARLMLHLTQRHLGQPAAPSLLATPAPATAGREWPDLLLRYVRGDATEEDLLFGAHHLIPNSDRAGRWCEAHYYLGSVRLLARDTRIARYAFNEAVSTGKTAFAEHTLALAELGRMVDLPESPKSRPTRRN